MPVTDIDRNFMRQALGLAQRGLGQVWPNPAVGAVVIDVDGRIVGRGWTQPGGRPHAETEALRRAGDRAMGGTLYVSLEPCNHHGKTPPCTEAIIKAGISRVVAGCTDPDERVSGSGFMRLRDAGLAVDTDCLREEAKKLNTGFFRRIAEERPFVTLKLATTLDGKIATSTGESQWITGDEARARAHMLRAENDAVLVGIGTVLADDPQLTCRLPGYSGRQPVRLVLDSNARMPVDAAMLDDAHDVWLLTGQGADTSALESRLDKVIGCPTDRNGRVDIGSALTLLAEEGITRIMVEGGGSVAASLLAANLVDTIVWARAGGVIGADGIGAVAPVGLEHLSDMTRYKLLSQERCGPDTLDVYCAR